MSSILIRGANLTSRLYVPDVKRLQIPPGKVFTETSKRLGSQFQNFLDVMIKELGLSPNNVSIENYGVDGENMAFQVVVFKEEKKAAAEKPSGYEEVAIFRVETHKETGARLTVRFGIGVRDSDHKFLIKNKSDVKSSSALTMTEISDQFKIFLESFLSRLVEWCGQSVQRRFDEINPGDRLPPELAVEVINGLPDPMDEIPYTSATAINGEVKTMPRQTARELLGRSLAHITKDRADSVRLFST